MKSDKIVDAFNTIQPGEEAKNRVFDKAMQRQHKKRPVFKIAVTFATAAAVICLMVFGSTLLSSQDDNIFAIKAYAMEVQEDGTVQLCEVEIADTRPEYWGGHIDGTTKTMYVGIGLRCEGENIESVEFTTDNGFFAQQYIGNLSEISTSGVTTLHVGPDSRMVMFGTDFDNVGSTITLDTETVEEYLLFWGTSYTDNPELSPYPQFPKEITIHAKVTFAGGKTAGKDVTIDLSGNGASVYIPSEEELAQNQNDYEAYRKLLQSIPLDKCEVMPDSVQTLTYGDTYEYSFGDPLTDGVAYYPIKWITEPIDNDPYSPRDESGIYRIGSRLPDDGSDGYIAVIERNGDDTFTGMVFKVSGQMILEHME